MTEQVFLTKFKEDVLDTDENISMEMVLDDIEEWDSLSVVSFIAMAKLATGKKVERQPILAAKTVRDLYALLQ